MNVLLVILSIVLLILAAGCGNAGQINGHSLATAHKSVNFIKEHLPASQKVEFEVAYWALRARYKADDEFLTAVDGKSAADLIALVKNDFKVGKQAGSQAYAQYDSWEAMIAEQTSKRAEQDRSAVDPKDKKGYPRVDYKLHAM